MPGVPNANCLIDFCVLYDTLCIGGTWGHPSSLEETAFSFRTQKRVTSAGDCILYSDVGFLLRKSYGQ